MDEELIPIKISEIPNAQALDGSEQIPAALNGANVNLTPDLIRGGLADIAPSTGATSALRALFIARELGACVYNTITNFCFSMCNSI